MKKENNAKYIFGFFDNSIESILSYLKIGRVIMRISSFYTNYSFCLDTKKYQKSCYNDNHQKQVSHESTFLSEIVFSARAPMVANGLMSISEYNSLEPQGVISTSELLKILGIDVTKPFSFNGNSFYLDDRGKLRALMPGSLYKLTE